MITRPRLRFLCHEGAFFALHACVFLRHKCAFSVIALHPINTRFLRYRYACVFCVTGMRFFASSSPVLCTMSTRLLRHMFAFLASRASVFCAMIARFLRDKHPLSCVFCAMNACFLRHMSAFSASRACTFVRFERKFSSVCEYFLRYKRVRSTRFSNIGF